MQTFTIVVQKVGFWGPPTATIDWCETNYQWSYYVAELWNTISNAIMLISGLMVCYIARKYCMELRFFVLGLSFLLVALGSAAFHGTLLFIPQLMDELPMCYAQSVFLFIWFEMYTDSVQRKWLAPFLVVWCIFLTYILFMKIAPQLFQIIFATMLITGIKLIQIYYNVLSCFFLKIAIPK